MRQLQNPVIDSVLGGIVLISLAWPAVSSACAVCGGGEADGYFWGVLFLMSMPFTIGSLVGSWLLYHHRRAASDPTSAAPHQGSESDRPREG
jgi:hypothetical protein